MELAKLKLSIACEPILPPTDRSVLHNSGCSLTAMFSHLPWRATFHQNITPLKTKHKPNPLIHLIILIFNQLKQLLQAVIEDIRTHREAKQRYNMENICRISVHQRRQVMFTYQSQFPSCNGPRLMSCLLLKYSGAS